MSRNFRRRTSDENFVAKEKENLMWRINIALSSDHIKENAAIFETLTLCKSVLDNSSLSKTNLELKIDRLQAILVELELLRFKKSISDIVPRSALLDQPDFFRIAKPGDIHVLIKTILNYCEPEIMVTSLETPRV